MLLIIITFNQDTSHIVKLKYFQKSYKKNEWDYLYNKKTLKSKTLKNSFSKKFGDTKIYKD